MAIDNTIVVYWIIGYVAILFFVGLLLSKAKSADAYLIANRKLGYTSSAITIIASKIGGGFLVTTSVLVFTYGLATLYLFAGFVVGFIVFYFFARKLQRESMNYKYYTMPDFFMHRSSIGNASAIVILSALSMFGWVITNFIAGGKLLSMITGVEFNLSIVLVAVVIFVYIYFAGFNAVVKTDILQFTSLIVLMIAFIFIAQKGLSSDDSIYFSSPMTIGQIATFFLTGILFPLGSAELWERVYAIEDRSKLKKSLITSSVLYVVFGLLLSIVCLYIKQANPKMEYDTGLIHGLMDLVDPAYVGLIVVAFASAILSSADTFVYSTASILGNHFSRSSETKDNSVKLIKKIVICVVVGGVLVSIALFNIIDVTYLFVSFTVSISLITISTLYSTKLAKIYNYAGSACLIIIPLAAILMGIKTIIVAFALFGVIVGYIIGYIKLRKSI